MKKVKTLALLALVLALVTQLACAEASDAVQGVYNAMQAEDSRYSRTKTMYAEFYEDIAWKETLREDGFDITVSGTEYMDGSWSFRQDGDYLTITVPIDDFTGMSLTLDVIGAVGDYLGLDGDVIFGYVNGLNALEMENENFIGERDDEAGTTTLRIRDTTPWDMKELDEIVLGEDNLSMTFDALGEEDVSYSANIGKLMTIVNGSAMDVTILLGEYGGLDELAYRSLINVVGMLKPDGWESFAEDYTALADVDAEDYSVRLNVGMDEVGEIIYDAKASYSYALIHFGK